MFSLAVRATLAAVLLVAAAGKVGTRTRFAAFGAWVGTLPIPFARAPMLPVLAVALEALIACCLVPPATAPFALPASAALFVVFAATAARVGRAGLEIDCHCFGTARGRLGRMHVWRDAVLAAAGLTSALTGFLRIGGRSGPGESCAFIVVGLLLAGFVVSLENLLALLRGHARYSSR